MADLKQLQQIIKTDKLLIGEIKNQIGNGNPTTIGELQNKLKYNDAEKLLQEIKSALWTSSNIDADKIMRMENDIKKLRETHFQICVYLNSIGGWKSTTPIPKEKKFVANPWKHFDESLFDPDLKLAFSIIKDEQIPIVISKERVIDLTKMPHLLVAGQTGSGKSVFLNAAIISIIAKTNPDNCKLVLIDPKRVEFSPYKKSSHLWAPVATKYDQAEKLLNSLIDEMEDRYECLEKLNLRNLESYNRQSKEKKPYIVLIIDELADLMMISNHGVENQITRLAQLARAVGIHIIMATQRPVVEIMTGLIKANMPARIAFKVASKQDSRIILDEKGAEALKGAGDMLFMEGGSIERHQGIYIRESDISLCT